MTLVAAPQDGRAPKAQRTLDIAGLRTTAVGYPDAPLMLVLLHGFLLESAAQLTWAPFEGATRSPW